MENEKLTLAPEKAEALKKHCLDILNEKHFINANVFFEVMEQVGIEQKVKSFAENSAEFAEKYLSPEIVFVSDVIVDSNDSGSVFTLSQYADSSYFESRREWIRPDRAKALKQRCLELLAENGFIRVTDFNAVLLSAGIAGSIKDYAKNSDSFVKRLLSPEIVLLKNVTVDYVPGNAVFVLAENSDTTNFLSGAAAFDDEKIKELKESCLKRIEEKGFLTPIDIDGILLDIGAGGKMKDFAKNSTSFARNYLMPEIVCLKEVIAGGKQQTACFVLADDVDKFPAYGVAQVPMETTVEAADTQESAVQETAAQEPTLKESKYGIKRYDIKELNFKIRNWLHAHECFSVDTMNRVLDEMSIEGLKPEDYEGFTEEFVTNLLDDDLEYAKVYYVRGEERNNVIVEKCEKLELSEFTDLLSDEQKDKLLKIKESIASVIKHNDNEGVPLYVVDSYLRRYNVKYVDYNARSIGEFFSIYARPEYIYVKKATIKGNNYINGALIPATKAKAPVKLRKLSAKKVESLSKVLRARIMNYGRIKIPDFRKALVQIGIEDFYNYSYSIIDFCERYLRPEFELLIDKNNPGNRAITLASMKDEVFDDFIKSFVAPKTNTMRADELAEKALSEDEISAIRNTIAPAFSDKDYITDGEYELLLKQAGVEDWHKNGIATLQEFTMTNIPEYFFAYDIILPGRTVLRAALCSSSKRCITKAALEGLRAHIRRIIDSKEYYVGSFLAEDIRKFTGADMYDYAKSEKEFVEKYLSEYGLGHYDFFYANREKYVQRNCIALEADRKKQEKLHERYGENYLKKSAEEFGELFRNADDQSVYSAVMMSKWRDEAKRNEFIGLYSKEVQNNYDNSTTNTINVAGDVNVIQNVISAISTDQSPEKIIEMISSIPKIADYVEDKKLLEAEIIEGEAEEEVTQSTDKIAQTIKEGINQADVNDDFDSCAVLGMKKEDYDLLMSKLDMYSRDDLYYAARFEAACSSLINDETIAANRKDLSPVTMMYSKLVERILKNYLSVYYAKHIPNVDTSIKYQKASGKTAKFADFLGQNATYLRNRSTIGTFLTPIRPGYRVNYGRLAGTDDYVAINETWGVFANDLSAVKGIRDQSAHVGDEERIGVAELHELKYILFKKELLKNILVLTKNI